VSLPVYTVSDGPALDQERLQSLRPCSRRGDGSLTPRQVPLPTLGPKLYSMAPPRHSTCMFTIESHLRSILYSLSRFQRFMLQPIDVRRILTRVVCKIILDLRERIIHGTKRLGNEKSSHRTCQSRYQGVYCSLYCPIEQCCVSVKPLQPLYSQSFSAFPIGSLTGQLYR